MGFKDITGEKFGYWTVLQKTNERSKSGTILWECQCDCGTIRLVDGTSLRQGKSLSCGCYNKEILSNRSNLIGQKFDKLTVISKSKEQTYGRTSWLCKCDCGKICDRTTSYLHRSDFIHSCGCAMTEHLSKDISNQRFGKLVAIQPTEKRNSHGIIWLCKCDCGRYHETDTNSLLSGNTSSCGCINYSIGEKNIENILVKNNILFKSQYTNKELNKKKFDFAILDDSGNPIRFIEFDGQQHYNDLSGIWNSKEELENIQKRDKIKNEYALSNNIPLVRIPYWERDKITLEMILGDQYLIK